MILICCVGIGDRIEYVPGSGRQDLFPDAQINLCDFPCQPESIQARVALSSSHGKNCDRDTYTVQVIDSFTYHRPESNKFIYRANANCAGRTARPSICCRLRDLAPNGPGICPSIKAVKPIRYVISLMLIRKETIWGIFHTFSKLIAIRLE